VLKRIGVGAAGVAAVLLVVAALRPDSFRVQRTASIKAPPEKFFPLISDLRAVNTWNPYERKDPHMKRSYHGAASGKGAAYAFEGNKDVGKGAIEITDAAAPSRVAMALRMREPFEADNRVEFTLSPRGDGTEVTWALQGPVPYAARLVHLFLDMDSMIGRDFEAGLVNLKAIAEKS
jgi:uncharacterized protein YndB with AHSA1/START domain